MAGGLIGFLMGDEGGDEAAYSEHFGEGDHGEGDGNNPEILRDEQAREDDRCDESGAALANEAEDLPKETFNGGAPKTAQNLSLRRTGTGSLRLQSLRWTRFLSPGWN